jgi:hypothetical protein
LLLDLILLKQPLSKGDIRILLEGEKLGAAE